MILRLFLPVFLVNCCDIPNISKHVHASLSDRSTEPIGCPSECVFCKHACVCPLRKREQMADAAPDALTVV